MAKLWVLDSETKGTGANMVPLEKVLEQPGSEEPVAPIVRRRPVEERGEPASPTPREPYRFRITDVMTRQVLAEDADARATVAVLEEARSVVDVAIDVWDPEAGAWRRLTLAEQKKLWEYRGVGSASRGSS